MVVCCVSMDDGQSDTPEPTSPLPIPTANNETEREDVKHEKVELKSEKKGL